MSDKVAASHMQLLQFQIVKIKENLKFCYCVTLAIFQALNRDMWLAGVTLLDCADIEHFHHRKFHWTILVYSVDLLVLPVLGFVYLEMYVI